MATQEMSIQLIYERHSDGRYYVRSDNLPGFRLAGTNLDALQADLDEVVKDLLLHNENFCCGCVALGAGAGRYQAPFVQARPWKARRFYIARGTIAAYNGPSVSSPARMSKKSYGPGIVKRCEIMAPHLSGKTKLDFISLCRARLPDTLTKTLCERFSQSWTIANAYIVKLIEEWEAPCGNSSSSC